MLTPKMQMVGSRSAADLAFEGEGGGGTLVSGLQIYICKYISLPANIYYIYIYIYFEGEDGGGTLVRCLQIYFCDSIPIDLLTFVFVVP